MSVVQRHAVRDLHAAVDFDVLLFGCHDTAASSNFRSTVHTELCEWRSHQITVSSLLVHNLGCVFSLLGFGCVTLDSVWDFLLATERCHTRSLIICSFLVRSRKRYNLIHTCTEQSCRIILCTTFLRSRHLRKRKYDNWCGICLTAISGDIIMHSMFSLDFLAG